MCYFNYKRIYLYYYENIIRNPLQEKNSFVTTYFLSQLCGKLVGTRWKNNQQPLVDHFVTKLVGKVLWRKIFRWNNWPEASHQLWATDFATNSRRQKKWQTKSLPLLRNGQNSSDNFRWTCDLFNSLSRIFPGDVKKMKN